LAASQPGGSSFACSAPRALAHMPELEDEPVAGEGDLPWSAYVFAVWNLIIRPPRARYSRYELMSVYPTGRFKVNRHPVQRSNFSLTNARGITLACTLFEPLPEKEGSAAPGTGEVRERACVVYCHGNGSCRLAGFQLVPALLPLNIALACFDFAGSGMSGGEYVSLGFHEQDDLRCVIEHLRGDRGFQRIGVWGYSMGAVTALMHSARDPTLAGVVADSPFSDLCQLIREICFSFLRLPSIVLSPLLLLVRYIISRKAAFDICDVSPQAHVGNCFVPALFLHGDKDDFVAPSHSELLQRDYRGEARRLTMAGLSHATRRPEAFIARASVFLVRALRWEPHLPPGVTEETLAALASRLAKGPQGERRELPQVADAAIAEIKALLAGGTEDVSLGLVRAACELCPAYRGASLVSCRVPPALPSSHLRARCPARFAGRLTFAGDHAEVAICWVQAAAASDTKSVHFAVLSPMAVSLTAVLLSRGAGGAQGPTCAGLACQAVEPLGLSAPRGGTALHSGQPHEVALQITADGAELSVGDVSVSAAAPSDGEVHLWCMQWDRDSSSPKALLELWEQPGPFTWNVSNQHSTSGISHRQGGAAATDGQRRLAEDLATLCLGTQRETSTMDAECGPPCADTPRVRWRSNVLVLDI